MYSNFSTEKVFLNETFNIYCNRLWTIAQDFATVESITLTDVFCISGTVAKIIQGDSVTAVQVVTFVTDSTALFDLFKEEKFKYFMEASVIVDSSKTIRIIYQGFYIEIVLLDDVGTINTESNLTVQDPADIPAYIL